MENKDTKNAYVRQVADQKYEYGFTTDVHTDIIEKGLNEDIVRLISEKKGEPDWMLEFRLKAFRHWQKLEQPTWGHVHVPEIDYQAISYYADPLAKKPTDEKKEIDPELMKTFDKLGMNRKGIVGVTMPGFGTTDRTYNNAITLMKSLGITIREISIAKAVTQHF